MSHAPDDLVTLATFKTTVEAELAKSRLESEGIAAFLGNDAAVGVMPFLSSGLGGITLQVAQKDAAQAKEILGS